jgi:hypothetical protein
MRNIKLIGLLLFGVMATAFVIKNPFTKNAATVEQIEGLYIYHLSNPVAEYDYIGTYKIGMILDNTPDLCLNKLIKKTKEQYPQAQAIIIKKDMYSCDAIKFK